MKPQLTSIRAGLGIAACIAALTGCTTINSVERAQPVAERQMVADKRVITDAGLNRRVNIVAINETTVSTGFAKVQIELLNTTRSACSFRYHFEWFDAAGMLVQSPTSTWIDRTIEGKEVMDISATAPTEAAKDFRVKFLSR